VAHAVIAAVVTWAILGFSVGIAGAQAAGTVQAGSFSVSAEALLWWFKDSPTPPLVTSGILGEPGTRVLLGGDDIDTDPNPGFRLSAAYAPSPAWGVETSVFYIPTRSTHRTVSSSGQLGSPQLFVPFVDVLLPEESVTELSSPGLFAGKARESLSNSLLGAELNATLLLTPLGPVRIDGLGGFRYLRLRETYSFVTDSPNITPQPADVFQTSDRFETTNNFFGLQVGARARTAWGPLFLTAVLKVALGAMVESADIAGRLVTNDFNNFGAVQTLAGGYFAQPTNIGNHTRHVFAVVPEAALNLGYRITPRLSVFAGYTFLYASNVLRATRQVNRDLNPFLIPAISGNPTPIPVGPAQPSYKFRASDFWAQGLNVGLAFGF
jgi:hypothetical protein